MKAEKYKTCSTKQERLTESQKIYETHLKPNASQQINVDQNLSKDIFENIQSSTLTSELFQEGILNIHDKGKNYIYKEDK
jgi:hypothetical protein